MKQKISWPWQTGDVLWREDGNVLRRALEHEAEGQGGKHAGGGETHEGWAEQGGCHLTINVG